MIFVEISKVESGDGRVLTFVSFGGDNDRFRLLCGFRAQVGSANVLLLKLEIKKAVATGKQRRDIRGGTIYSAY